MALFFMGWIRNSLTWCDISLGRRSLVLGLKRKLERGWEDGKIHTI